MNSRRLVVACIQHACVDGRDANLATSAALVRSRAADGSAASTIAGRPHKACTSASRCFSDPESAAGR